ncbi:hypothetical protein KAI04_04555 [Candidatus Pacearchaeota archaeon]|nr:hypothetical protein [Candidatus Pacearchaeota archaeon]
MVKKNYKKIILFSALIIFLIALITLLFFVSPEEIVNKLGVRNAYFLVFLVSFFGGFSAGGSLTFISLLITLAIGGMNPLYLGLVSGTSLAIGDMIMFYVFSKGRELVKNKWDKRINKVANVFKKRKWLQKMIPFFAYIYIGFIPLPNDILILFLAAIEYPAKKVNASIILGDLTFALMVAILASKGIMFFV